MTEPENSRVPSSVRVAILGVGNCASALMQGISHYRDIPGDAPDGLMRPMIGGLGPGNIDVVAAFDVDRRKVGKPLGTAIFAPPNCTRRFRDLSPDEGVTVQMAPILDGIAPHMADHPDDQAFRAADAEPIDLAEALRASGAEVLVSYLPVGSERAAHNAAEACLSAGVAMLNCMPVFLASKPEWAERFRTAGVPIIGDDIKSQVGATIVHRVLTHLFEQRGCQLDRTYQLNTGGNTDFLNMLARDRLDSKKRSKTGSVQSQLGTPLPDTDIHVGPSDYVAWQKDNKVCFIRMEGRGFGGAPIELELRLSVVDSPNSAGVVIDAIRCLQLARKRGLAGPIEAPSAAYMKTPPRQMDDDAADRAVSEYVKD